MVESDFAMAVLDLKYEFLGACHGAQSRICIRMLCNCSCKASSSRSPHIVTRGDFVLRRRIISAVQHPQAARSAGDRWQSNTAVKQNHTKQLACVCFTVILDDIVFPDGRTHMGALGGGGPICRMFYRCCSVTWNFRHVFCIVAGGRLACRCTAAEQR